MSVSILSLIILVAATSSTLAAPAPSTLSCHDDICMDGPDDMFVCSERRLVCCKGRTNSSFQVFTQRRGFECCAGKNIIWSRVRFARYISRLNKFDKLHFLGAGKLFETQREICVSGQVRAKGQDEEICGSDRTYNTSNQACCGGNVFPKVAGWCSTLSTVYAYLAVRRKIDAKIGAINFRSTVLRERIPNRPWSILLQWNEI